MESTAKLTVRRVRLDALVPDPSNPCVHDERNLEAIRASLQRFGEAEPIVVQAGSRRIIAGHGRLSAHPRHLLRGEAVARSRALRRVVAATAKPRAEASTKTPSSDPIDLELRADLARLNATQREILRALLVAVRVGEGLILR